MPLMNMLVATAEGAGFDASSIQPLIDSLTSQISPSTVISILALVVGSGTALALTWFGVRKVVSVIMTAFQKGKVRI